MKKHVSKKRRQIENELLFYLRKYRYFSSKFRHIEDLNSIINDIVEELKKDI